MYKVQHLLDNNKISKFKTEKEFIDFTKLIVKENDDDNDFIINTVQDCVDYINEYCENLKII